MQAGVLLSAVAALSGAALGQNFIFFNEIGGMSTLQPNGGPTLEASLAPLASGDDFYLDTTAFGPARTDSGDIGSTGGDFSLDAFTFDLSYSASAQELTWVVRDGDGTVNSLTLSTGGVFGLNTIGLHTDAAEASIDLSALRFQGLGFDVQSFPDLDDGPFADGEKSFLFFGNQVDLLSGDWELTGEVGFGSFLGEPGGGTGLRFEVLGAFGVVIPAPSGAGALAIAGLLASRRRR